MNNKLQEILSKVEISNKSVEWWENHVVSILAELDYIESLGDEASSEQKETAEKLLDQLPALLAKGRIELNTINKLEQEIIDFQNEKTKKVHKKKKS